MLIAIMTDLHANQEALTACLHHAQQHGAQQYAFLGDMVGYGANPGWVIDTVMELANQGALVVCGNHDAAVLQQTQPQMHSAARQAITWTRAQLNPEQLDFLTQLPMSVERYGCLFVHATAAHPQSWDYITGTREAVTSMYATTCRITFCGHVHEPALYNLTATGKIAAFIPTADCDIPLGQLRRWLVIPGSVGQPRDGNPAACYALFDTEEESVRFLRVPYDHESATRKILAAGLPEDFATRLSLGV